ncbi:MAG: hypothetical protein GY898_14620 [Proteobacteria bacterium]|nr:hypothetical protein [Pseudomonadota bacterium]
MNGQTITIGLLAVLTGIGLLLNTQFGDELGVLLDRGDVPDAVQPFFPEPNADADAIIAAVRDALDSWAALESTPAAGDDDDSAEPVESVPMTAELLEARHPALNGIDYGDRWILSVYVPTRGDWIRPRITTLERGAYAAAADVWSTLTVRQKTASVLSGASIKVDLIVGEERSFPAEGGERGVALDEGIDGIVLRHPKRKTFWYPPSLSVERKVSRRKIHARARFYARELGGWRRAQTKEAEFAAFRTKAWVQIGDGPVTAITRGNVDVPEITPELLRERIDLAAQYMTRETNEHGMIRYQYEATEDDDDFDSYNLLRHAGSVYAMAQAYRLTEDEALFDAALRAMGFFLRITKEDEKNPGERFVVNVNRLNTDLTPRVGRTSKLGGIGLGLCAMAELQKARPGSVSLETTLEMARHVERMQNPDGSFDSFYDWTGTDKRLRKSIYYSGEAILGLLRVYQVTGDEHWLDVAEKGADYLVDERWNSLGLTIYTPPDAWLIQALEELDRERPDPDREAYAFAIGEQIARHKQMDPLKVPEDMLGAGLSGVSSLPHAATAGSFGEALSAAARLEARRRPGESRFRTFALYNAEYNIRNQYWGPNEYALPNPARAHGGFRVKPDHGEVRNDHVQHSMSGLFGLLDLLDETAPDIAEKVQP